MKCAPLLSASWRCQEGLAVVGDYTKHKMHEIDPLRHLNVFSVLPLKRSVVISKPSKSSTTGLKAAARVKSEKYGKCVN